MKTQQSKGGMLIASPTRQSRGDTFNLRRKVTGQINHQMSRS